MKKNFEFDGLSYDLLYYNFNATIYFLLISPRLTPSKNHAYFKSTQTFLSEYSKKYIKIYVLHQQNLSKKKKFTSNYENIKGEKSTTITPYIVWKSNKFYTHSFWLFDESMIQNEMEKEKKMRVKI